MDAKGVTGKYAHVEIDTSVCEHGSLRRKCEVCDLGDAVERLTDFAESIRAEASAGRPIHPDTVDLYYRQAMDAEVDGQTTADRLRAERDELKAELEKVRKFERTRWESARSAFGMVPASERVWFVAETDESEGE